ncbi:MAG: ABC transporter substrate-binding protein, partial [Lachnospiraceae bacterium]|nr:ABC transporter substrate-binding protein [Lachnospiraceae bacterium]
SNEIQTVVQSMVGEVDVIYAPTDNMIAAGMATVSMVATENKIPIIVGEEGMCNNGGLATYGIDYYKLGQKTADMAKEILEDGKDPAEMPIQYLSVDECALTVNQEIADELGIDTSVLDEDLATEE